MASAPHDAAAPVPRAGHTPLLWVCVPLLCGCACAMRFAFADMRALALAGLACAVGAAACVFWGRERPLAWKIFFFAAWVCLGWGYYLWRSPPLPEEWHRLPPREMDVALEIDRVFTPSRAGAVSVSGLGRIVGAPDFAASLVGRRAYFRFYAEGGEWLAGARATVRGVVAPIGREGSDFDNYLAENAVRLSLTRGRVLVRERGASFIARACARANAACEKCLTRGFSPQVANVFVAMMLGKTRALLPEQKEDFTLTGTLHLFAVSGLHVGLMAAVLAFICACARIGRRVRPWIVLPLLLVYVGITGFPPSAVRAFAMIAFVWGGLWLGRPGDAISGLALSAVCLLCYDPAVAGNAGFQLSYAVVAAMLLYGVPLGAVLEARWLPYRDVPEKMRSLWQRASRWLVRKTSAALAISLAAFLASAPLCAETFGTFAYGGVLLNLCLIPLATPIVGAGVFSLLLGAAGAPDGLVAGANSVGVFLSQTCALVAGAAHAMAPALFQTVHAPFAGFGALASALLLAALVAWRARLAGKSLAYYLLPFGLWGFLMSLVAF